MSKVDQWVDKRPGELTHKKHGVSAWVLSCGALRLSGDWGSTQISAEAVPTLIAWLIENYVSGGVLLLPPCRCKRRWWRR